MFCEIVKGNKPREILSESEKTITILSNPCKMRGHCLTIPKRHVEKLSELSKEEINELIEEIINVEEILLKKFPGCDIKQNYRPFIPNSKFKVSHLHFHIQPREFEDELYNKSQVFEKDVFRELSEEELKQIKLEIFN